MRAPTKAKLWQTIEEQAKEIMRLKRVSVEVDDFTRRIVDQEEHIRLLANENFRLAGLLNRPWWRFWA